MTRLSATGRELLEAAREMSAALAALQFEAPVTHIYDPLQYAWAPYEAYITRYGGGRKRFVLLGMNPGPFGMMQTGVPFGEVAAVRDWMGITAEVKQPASTHPKRLIQGFACTRSEVSGRRLWGWAQARFGAAQDFFAEWFVVNYCPLVFLEASGRNFTPDRLPAARLRALQDICDAHLVRVLAALRPEWVLGVGGFAEKRLRSVLEGDAVDGAIARSIRIGQILHPSPASPAANRGWEPAVDKQLQALGIP